MRYDATTPREYTDRDGNKRTNWTRLGAGFAKDGRITVLLDALPLPGPDGTCKIVLMEPRENSGGQREQPRQQRGGGGSAFDHDLDDDVPFASCDPRRENYRRPVI